MRDGLPDPGQYDAPVPLNQNTVWYLAVRLPPQAMVVLRQEITNCTSDQLSLALGF